MRDGFSAADKLMDRVRAIESTKVLMVIDEPTKPDYGSEARIRLYDAATSRNDPTKLPEDSDQV